MTRSPYNSRRLVFFAICLLACLRGFAQQPTPPRNIPVLFSNVCASCHGLNMRGAQFRGFIPENWTRGSDDESLARAIRLGSTNPVTPMPPMGPLLSEAEIRGMVVYIRETVAKAKNETNTFPKPVNGAVVSSREHKFKLTTVVTNGLTTPWSIAFLPNRSMLVTELPGRLRVVENGKLLPAVSGTPPVRATGQGGLMDVKLHPGYSSNGWVYVGFSDGGSNSSANDVNMTAIARGRIHNNTWTDGEVIFRAPIETYVASGLHFGNRLVFDDKGYLFFTIGERGRSLDAQNTSLPNGKVHRIHDDGRIPADNPFVNQPGAFKTLWTYGNRNPQGLARHPVTGEIWETEHGPRGGDELNLIQPGRNYGWPVICYGMDYNGIPITGGETAREGMEQPVTYWTPSIAVCGITFYSGDKFPKWKNNLLVTSLAAQEFRRLVIERHEVKEQEILFKDIGRVRAVTVGPDGFIYLALNKPDWIVRLEPAD